MKKSVLLTVLKVWFPKGTFLLMVPFSVLTFVVSMLVQHYSMPGSKNGLIAMASMTFIYAIILGFQRKIFGGVKLRGLNSRRQSSTTEQYNPYLAERKETL